VIAQGDAQAKALRAVQEQMMAAGDGQGAANATQQKLGAMMRLLEAASAQYGIDPDTLLQGLSGRLTNHTPPADRE
jgi:flotillin